MLEEEFPKFEDLLMTPEESSQRWSDVIYELTGQRFRGVKLVKITSQPKGQPITTTKAKRTCEVIRGYDEDEHPCGAEAIGLSADDVAVCKDCEDDDTLKVEHRYE